MTSPQFRSSTVLDRDGEIHRRLAVPANPSGIVLLVDEVRAAPIDEAVVSAAADRGIATVRVGVLDTHHDPAVGHLADRIVESLDWLRADERLRELPVGLFGSSATAGATLVAAARRPGVVSAVVCCHGAPGPAADALPVMTAPTLLIVGSRGADRADAYRAAIARQTRPSMLSVTEVVDASADDPSAAAQVARLAMDWFTTEFRAVHEAMSRRGLGDPAC